MSERLERYGPTAATVRLLSREVLGDPLQTLRPSGNALQLRCGVLEHDVEDHGELDQGGGREGELGVKCARWSVRVDAPHHCAGLQRDSTHRRRRQAETCRQCLLEFGTAK